MENAYDNRGGRENDSSNGVAELVTVKVFTHVHLSLHAHYDLVEPGRLSDEFVFRVPRTLRVREFKKTHLLPALEMDNIAALRLHTFARRKSGGLRPSRVVSNKKRLELGSLLTRYHEEGVMLFAEKSYRTDAPFFANSHESVRLLFFKFFNPLIGTLQYLTSLDVGTSRDATLRSVESQLRRRVGLLDNERLLWFEEIGPGTVGGVNPKRSLTERGSRSGDVFVFQTVASTEVATIPEQYRLLRTCVVVGFLSADAGQKRIVATCPGSNTYEQLQATLATRLPRDYCDDPRRLQFKYEPGQNARKPTLRELLGVVQGHPLPVSGYVQFQVLPAAPAAPPPIPAKAAPVSEERLCVVCLVNQKSHAFVPCGHLCVCAEDSLLMKTCPLCRAAVTGTLRVFL